MCICLASYDGVVPAEGQIAHQERRNNDLFSSNAALSKLNSELTAQLEELKSKNDELTTT